MVDKDDVSSPSLGDFVADVVYGIDPHIIHDGAKYHKSSLVNSILNSHDATTVAHHVIFICIY